MDRQRRSNLAAGLVLVLLGLWFLAVQLLPGLRFWSDSVLTWPLVIVAAGVLLLVIGLLTGVPAMAVPAAIISGIGGLLYWQNETGNWASWAYAWSLIPGFVGVGILLSGLLGQEPRRSIPEGIQLVLTSLVLFTIFASFFGGLNLFGRYWPVLLILFGVWLLIRPVFRYRS